MAKLASSRIRTIRRSCRIAAFSTISSATKRGNGACQGAAWDRSPVNSNAPPARPARKCKRGSALSAIEAGKIVRTVHFNLEGKTHAVEARFLLVNFGRNVLARYLANQWQPDATDEGSVFKINMLLRRLPKLKTADHPTTDAFCGTFHCDEGYEEMNRSANRRGRGEMPERLPGACFATH